MKIICAHNIDSNPDIDTLRWEIVKHFDSSRFNCNVEIRRKSSRRTEVHVTQVRLKDKKSWCGSHAESCDIQGMRDRQNGGFIKERPVNRKLLEGLDWVDFNDQLNDVLDRLNFDGKVESAVCIIRKGKQRRVQYDSVMEATPYRVEYEWAKEGYDDHYEDWCLSDDAAPASIYPEGTPGIYSRSVQVSL